MKTHQLDISKLNDTADVIDFFEESNIEQGDTLKLLTEDKSKGVTVLIIAFVVIILLKYLFEANKITKEKEGEQILNDLFIGKSVEEIEQQVEEDYGIKIEMEIKKQDNNWNTASMQYLAKEYAIDEPDYNNVSVKEPNPEYKPWKKEL